MVHVCHLDTIQWNSAALPLHTARIAPPLQLPRDRLCLLGSPPACKTARGSLVPVSMWLGACHACLRVLRPAAQAEVIVASPPWNTPDGTAPEGQFLEVDALDQSRWLVLGHQGLHLRLHGQGSRRAPVTSWGRASQRPMLHHMPPKQWPGTSPTAHSPEAHLDHRRYGQIVVGPGLEDDVVQPLQHRG